MTASPSQFIDFTWLNKMTEPRVFFVPTRDTRTLPADFELSQGRRPLQDSLTGRHAAATFTTPASQALGRFRVTFLISTEPDIFKPLLKQLLARHFKLALHAHRTPTIYLRFGLTSKTFMLFRCEALFEELKP